MWEHYVEKYDEEAEHHKSVYLRSAPPIFIAFLVCAAEARNPWQGARVDLHSRGYC